MVNMLLTFLHLLRVGNWKGYLASIREFLQYCCSLNRHNCAQSFSYYYSHMLSSKEENLEAFQYLHGIGFTGSPSEKSHSMIPMDQIIEMKINWSCWSFGQNRKLRCQWQIGKNSPLHGSNAGTTKWKGAKEHKTCQYWTWRLKSGKKWIRCTNDHNMSKELNTKYVAFISTNQQYCNRNNSHRGDEEKYIESYGKRKTSIEWIYLEIYWDLLADLVNLFKEGNAKEKCSISEDERQSSAGIFSIFDNKNLDLRKIIEWPLTSKPLSIFKEENHGAKTM